jgi:hypothetical protein
MSKYDEERIKPLLELIKKGVPLKHACAAVGITYSTFWNWRKTIEQFDLRVREAEVGMIESNVNAIRAAGMMPVRDKEGKVTGFKGDWRANAFLIERRFPKEYGAHQKLEHEIGENTMERIMRAAADKREQDKEDKADKAGEESDGKEDNVDGT